MSSVNLTFESVSLEDNWRYDGATGGRFQFWNDGGVRSFFRCTTAQAMPSNSTVVSFVGKFSFAQGDCNMNIGPAQCAAYAGQFGGDYTSKGSGTISSDLSGNPDSFVVRSVTFAGPFTLAEAFNAVIGLVPTSLPGTEGNRRVRWNQTANAGSGVTLNFTLPTPTATTNAASNVTLTGAQLNGTINPNGANAAYPVSYKFEWGLTAAYGNTTTVTGGQTGSSDTPVSAQISGLTSGLTYHYRVVALNADVTTNGSDVSFTAGTSQSVMMIL